MIKKKADSARAISGKSPEDVARSVSSELGRIWVAINDLTEKVNSLTVGTPNVENGSSGVRLVQEKGLYHIEGKFKDGWARLATTTTLLSKKD